MNIELLRSKWKSERSFTIHTCSLHSVFNVLSFLKNPNPHSPHRNQSSSSTTMSEPLPPPPLAHRGTPPPRAGAFRPVAPPRGNRRPVPIQKASFSFTSVLKLLGLLGLVGFSVVQYQNHRQTVQNSIKIENARSLAIDDGSNLNLFLVRFTHQGTPGVLLWKSGPGIELIAGPENSLQSPSGHKLRFETLAKTNYVNSDYTIVGLPDDQILHSTSSHDYTQPEITQMLPHHPAIKIIETSRRQERQVFRNQNQIIQSSSPLIFLGVLASWRLGVLASWRLGGSSLFHSSFIPLPARNQTHKQA